MGAGGGAGVLDGTARLVERSGRDVTAMYLRGAEAALALAQEHGIGHALLKSRSPSCGLGVIYDGTFEGSRIVGDGVAAALLARHRVQVFTEDAIDELERELGGSTG